MWFRDGALVGQQPEMVRGGYVECTAGKMGEGEEEEGGRGGDYQKLANYRILDN